MPRFRTSLTVLSVVWLSLLGAVAVSRFGSSLGWRIDLVATVSYFVAAPAVVTGLLYLGFRRWRLMTAALIITAVAAWPVVPQIWPNFAARQPADIRLYLCNIHAPDPDPDRVIRSILAAEPDVVVLLETGMHRTRAFVDHPAIAEAYPFAQAPRRGATWPILILSRWPLHRLEFEPTGGAAYDSLFAYHRSTFVDSPAGRFALAATHPPSPRTASAWQEGNATVEALCEVIQSDLRATGVPIVVAGDFNTSPTGRRYRIMRSRSGLHSDLGAGSLSGTWPSRLPAPLRLALDQVWASEDVEFIDREILDDVGSDHRPVLVALRLTMGRDGE